ncbi:MAG: metallophosphoesterase [Aquisalimonadaceae bacterium]
MGRQDRDERRRHAERLEEVREALKKGELLEPGVTMPGMSRRTFIHKSLVFGGAAAGVSAAKLWLPLINTFDMAYAAEGGMNNFRFAWVSDTHLYPEEVNDRFVEKAKLAVEEINALDPPADFVVIGGDVAQLGDPVELRLGKAILDEIDVEKHYIPGEHDWYLDMGELWVDQFGEAPWTFDHKGVRFIGLDTVGHGPDYWSATNMTPEQRMGHMAGLDNSVTGPWAGLGKAQREWLQSTLSDWPKDDPVIIFSHNPLYEYYPPWNFWTRDWRETQEILAPYTNVTSFHGHTHQVLYNEIGNFRSIGMLATAWPWPYAPENVPKLTRPMTRVDPGDHFDGVGWDLMRFRDNRAEHEYMMWRRRDHLFASRPEDTTVTKNATIRLRSRVADRQWVGKYKGTD